MRRLVPLSLAFSLCLPAAAHAGNLYGTLWLNNKPAPGAQIKITCADRQFDQTTDSEGEYRIFVSEKGRCIFRVTVGGQSGQTDVASYDNAIKYDFDLIPQKGGGYTLARR